jgi:NADPH:quinone reductase-like Zn-dependent oxidoreductase
LALKPAGVSFEEAEVLPVIYLTAFHALFNVAMLQATDTQATDTVLIHASSGGMNAAAMQLAKLVGCKVIVTASSDEKGQFWKDLGCDYVFHSHDTSYADDVLLATGNKGVNVVLNSLRGNDKEGRSFIEMTLKSAGKNARWAKIGKAGV